MTNYSRWNLVLRDVTSPQSFIDFGYYFLISAALQRRVWIGGLNPNIPGQLYPNIFVILTGPAGVGKGRVITQVNSILKHWKLDVLSGNIFSDDHTAQDNDERDSLPLFSAGPEDVTYQALLQRQAKAIRYVDWVKCRGSLDNKPVETPAKYGSSPVYFSLEELSSLFDKDSKRVAKYLLNAYDCNDYRKDTVGRGADVLKKPCLTFLAGTTPSFLEENLDTELLSDGLSARFWFIYEMVERNRLWDIKPPDAEQTRARNELLEFVKQLASVYGHVTFTPEADAYLKDWWENTLLSNKPNNNPKLIPYYVRKNIHVRKMAMILHFSEQTESYVIPLETAQRALEVLDNVEKKMHFALTFKGRNPLGSIAVKILDFMFDVKRPVLLEEILAPEGGGFYNELNMMEVSEVMRFLQSTGKVISANQRYFPKALTNSPVGQALLKAASKKEPTVGADLPALPLAPDVKPGGVTAQQAAS